MIHLVTDGTAGLPAALAASLKVRVVPVSYSFAGRQFSEAYLDRGQDHEAMLRQHEGECYTSHPPVSLFANAFRNLTRDGDQLLCLVISSRLSGTYSSACIAAQDVPGAQIAVVDSLSTAGGLALLLEEAARCIREGMSLADCVQHIEAKRTDVGLIFSVSDMSSLRRSGRLGLVRQSIGNMLNLRPILCCEEGIVRATGTTRGSAQTLKALVSQLPEGVKAVVIHHQGEANDPEPLARLLRERFPQARIEQRPVGAALRIHLGAGFIGIAWIK